jgi:TRASH domain-containing protein
MGLKMVNQKIIDVEENAIHCDYCHKVMTGRKFIFRVIGHTFVMCSKTCRDYIVSTL